MPVGTIDLLIFATVAFLVSYLVRGSILLRISAAVLVIVLLLVAFQGLGGHMIRFWEPAFLLRFIGGTAVGVSLALLLRRLRG